MGRTTAARVGLRRNMKARQKTLTIMKKLARPKGGVRSPNPPSQYHREVRWLNCANGQVQRRIILTDRRSIVRLVDDGLLIEAYGEGHRLARVATKWAGFIRGRGDHAPQAVVVNGGAKVRQERQELRMRGNGCALRGANGVGCVTWALC
jgi:hypothetical protein